MQVNNIKASGTINIDGQEIAFDLDDMLVLHVSGAEAFALVSKIDQGEPEPPAAKPVKRRTRKTKVDPPETEPSEPSAPQHGSSEHKAKVQDAKVSAAVAAKVAFNAKAEAEAEAEAVVPAPKKKRAKKAKVETKVAPEPTEEPTVAPEPSETNGVPKQVKNARSFKEIVNYCLMNGLTNPGDIAAACADWQATVPLLAKVKDVHGRVERILALTQV